MMHWDWYTQNSFWTGMILGFGIMAVIMVIGFYLLLKSIQEVKDTVIKMESKVENIERRVDDVAKQLEEI